MTARAMQWFHEDGLPEPLRPLESARGGYDVPGYTGYIAGKVPEMDIVGGTFAKVNQHIAKNDRTNCGPLGFQSTPIGLAPSPRENGFMGGSVPGYTGYIPGKCPEADVFGKTFADSNAHVLEHGCPPTGRGKGPWQGPPPPKHIDIAKAHAKVPGHAHAMVSVPGYAGFVPAKKAENVHGASFSAANIKASKEFHKVTYQHDGSHGKPAWRRTSAPGVEDRKHKGAGPGIGIPGYKGHTPGKKPEADMMGMTFAEVNKHANRQHKIRRGKIPEDHPYCDSLASGPSGASTWASGSYQARSLASSASVPSTSRRSHRDSRPGTAPSLASSRLSRSSSALEGGHKHSTRPASARAPGTSRASTTSRQTAGSSYYAVGGTRRIM
mmetsp:Transcript_71444/g.149310  ORF Transcript_71444/g.149310 Transcript_71444/m.149310 type:complete len:382 (-) Transcript_71444:399-1544(-)